MPSPDRWAPVRRRGPDRLRTGKQAGQRAELLGHHEGAWFGEHDPPVADAIMVRVPPRAMSAITSRRRGLAMPGMLWLLRPPVTLIGRALGMDGRSRGFRASALPGILALADRGEDRETSRRSCAGISLWLTLLPSAAVCTSGMGKAALPPIAILDGPSAMWPDHTPPPASLSLNLNRPKIPVLEEALASAPI